MKRLFPGAAALVAVGMLGCSPFEAVSESAESSAGGAGGGSPIVADAGFEIPSHEEDTLAGNVCKLVLAMNCTRAEGVGEHLRTCLMTFEEGSERGCASLIRKAYECVSPHGTSGLVCQPMLGPYGVGANTTNCAESWAIAMRCTGSTTRFDCYGERCSSAGDCPQGQGCNETTGHCLKTSAVCVGLPCKATLSCPSGESCRPGIDLCVAN